MKISKLLVPGLILVGIVTVVSAFKMTGKSSEAVKYDYAIVHLSFDENNSKSGLLYIKYSNGKVEDYKTINQIPFDSLANHVDRYVMRTFKYLNQQNYELQSSNMSSLQDDDRYRYITMKEFYFSRKVEE